jgi:hypothetical protein
LGQLVANWDLVFEMMRLKARINKVCFLKFMFFIIIKKHFKLDLNW